MHVQKFRKKWRVPSFTEGNRNKNNNVKITEYGGRNQILNYIRPDTMWVKKLCHHLLKMSGLTASTNTRVKRQ